MASRSYSNLVRFIFFSLVLIFLLINEIPSSLYLNMAGFIQEFKEINSRYKTMTENFLMKQHYERKKKDLLIQLESINYNYNLLQEEILNIINNHCLSNNIIIENVAFIINDDEVIDQDELDDNNHLRVMSVAIEFKCNYDNLLLFIDELKNDTVEIAVLNMRIVNWNNGIVNVVANLNFYSFNYKVNKI